MLDETERHGLVRGVRVVPIGGTPRRELADAPAELARTRV
jgi:hypothetical protein